MTNAGARDAVNGAALVVAGLYFYRKLIEPASGGGAAASATVAKQQPTTIPAAAAQVIGFGPLASTGRFIVGFGVTFLTLSLLEGASPDLAGYFALLIALGSILGNGIAATEDVKMQLNEKQQSLNKLAAKAEPNTPTVQVAAWEVGPSAARIQRKPQVA